MFEGKTQELGEEVCVCVCVWVCVPCVLFMASFQWHHFYLVLRGSNTHMYIQFSVDLNQQDNGAGVSGSIKHMGHTGSQRWIKVLFIEACVKRESIVG